MTLSEIDNKIKDYDSRISRIVFSAEWHLTDEEKKSVAQLEKAIEALKREREKILSRQ